MIPQPVTVEKELQDFGTYCFDVDSTLISVEGIEVLAANREEDIAKYVQNMTGQAMGQPSGTRMSYDEIFQLRLKLIKPTKTEIEMAARYIVENCITDEAKRVVPELIGRGKQVFLVSGGIEQIVGAVARKLGVTAWFSVPLLFNESGTYELSQWAPTMMEDGKQQLAYYLAQATGAETIMFVGDGITDMLTQNVVDCFAAYTGIKRRPIVVEGADIELKTLDDLVRPGRTVTVTRNYQGV